MKKPIIAAIALILGAMAAFTAARWVNVAQHTGPKVVIVALPIELGKAITAEQIKAVNWPGTDAPQGAYANTADVVSRIARVSMMPGEPVLPGKLAPKGATGGLASIIPDGKRAITVKVNEVIAVAGFALPGSYVDVLVSGKDASHQPFARTVLNRVKVLAIAQETTAEPDKPKVVNAVTLELTPHESEKLDLARSIGSLSLVLRNELDTGEENSAGVRMSDLMYAQSTSGTSSSTTAHAPASRQYRGPEEIRGTSRQSVATP
ncbi:Flp pilus assembly protein CpaB [Pelodictyon luteolum]|uniref:Pilus assembly protein CpaB n=1 Tax=Chlorobium luteolum (strain DSM 273 / BCRC 81028 / 2530) TaxID=319225 RepID=Q3B543_CHLL3|nr:Flp pilus assembly protein CpaB [Pelodictyon luteolum]ABB23538.1 pilus assembly protein CpaB [Pelodictyon luteolum DSM 273]